MNSRWIELKKEIKRETQRVFQSNSSIDLDETIDLFKRVLEFPLNNSDIKVDGLDLRVSNAMDRILLEGLNKADNMAYFPDFAKVEPFLRKILFITDPSRYITIASSNPKPGFNKFINELNINPNNIDFHKKKIEDLKGSPNYGEYLYRTYHLRNIESHACEHWSRVEIWENIESILIVYLYATHVNAAKLRPILDSIIREKESDFTEYLIRVKDEFKFKISRFVDIKGEEDLKLSDAYAIENIGEIDDEESQIERKGTIDDLRKNQIPEKRMMIWGDAGMGKSTTLEYLAFIDADANIKMPLANLPIPVYIPLGLLTDKNVTIKQAIFNKIGVDNNQGEKMLRSGKLNIFLDAINEIPKDDNYQLKTMRIKEVQNILNEYKNCFIIISNRPQDINEIKGIPVFHLQKMDDTQIEKFLDRNTDGNEMIKKKILDEINNDKRLKRIIKTPLMLSRIIEIIKSEGDIPKSEGEIIDRFIYTLYKREKEEKKDAYFDIKKIHFLLRYLGYETLEKKETNSGMSDDEILNFMVECKKKYGFDIDIIYVLDISTQLGILEKRDSMYTFAHQAYQDYFHSQEEKARLGL